MTSLDSEIDCAGCAPRRSRPGPGGIRIDPGPGCFAAVVAMHTLAANINNAFVGIGNVFQQLRPVVAGELLFRFVRACASKRATRTGNRFLDFLNRLPGFWLA